jgi:signal transduction histidine kinase
VSAPTRARRLPAWLPSPTDRDWRVLDRLFALAFLAAIEMQLVLDRSVEGPLVLNMLLYGVTALSLLVRRDHPLVPVVTLTAAGILGEAFLTGPPDVATVIVLLICVAYSVGAHAEQRRALLGLLLVFAVILVVTIVRHDSDIAFPFLFFGFMPWLVGRTMRHQQALSRELAEKADRAELAREEAERRAIAAERARVARELHDVLAHNLSVMVVQASAARRILERDPDTASDAAHLIRATGREALTELRQVFGAVRRGEGEPLEGPPSIKQVERLATRAREAGLGVRVRVEGNPVPLPAGVDVTAYRVVQEALTNAIKHAGPARAVVTVRYEPWELVVEVEDNGAGPTGSGGLSATGGGHGLVGMRERVEVYGGRLQAGRRRGGGYAVRARLPVLSTVSTEVVA